MTLRGTTGSSSYLPLNFTEGEVLSYHTLYVRVTDVGQVDDLLPRMADREPQP